MTTIQINPNELSNKKVLVKRLREAYATVRASYINGTEYVINGGTIPTV